MRNYYMSGVASLFVAFNLMSGCSSDTAPTAADRSVPDPVVAPDPVPPASGTAAESGPWSAVFGETSADDDLTIPAGISVSLDDCDVEFASLTVQGSFTVDNAATTNNCSLAEIRAQTIMAMGPEARITFGSQTSPFEGKLEVTLTGSVNGRKVGMAEQRSFMVMMGAEFEAFGASALKDTWTSLEGTVLAGARRISVAEDTGWEVGDHIVIASSNIDPREAEDRIITEISDDGRTLTLDRVLQYDHFGKMQSFGGRTIDTRAEIGLLSHNIVIQGDEGSEIDEIGGHIMIMNRDAERPESPVNDLYRPDYDGKISQARIEGVELRRMGQKGRPGRYSFHWHLISDGSGQYVRNSSMHHGFQRAVNVHGTDDTLVENNVAYDIFNHMFIPSEEGDEVRNVFRGNLGILSRAVLDPEDFAFPDEDRVSPVSAQSEHRASVFWARNVFNKIENNRAAGAWNGHGYFLDPDGANRFHQRLAYEAANDTELCDFTGNMSHSNFRGLVAPAHYGPAARGFGVFMRRDGYRYERGARNDDGTRQPDSFTNCTFTDTAVYKSQLGGIWVENHTTIDGAIVTDSHTGIFSGQIVRDVVVVGQTENNLPTVNKFEIGGPYLGFTASPSYTLGGFFQGTNGGQDVRDRDFSNITCINLPACFNNATQFSRNAHNYDLVNAFNGGAKIDNVTLIDTPRGFVVGYSRTGEYQTPRLDPDADLTLGEYTDLDGSLTGVPNSNGDMNSDVFQRAGAFHDHNIWGWEWDIFDEASSD